MYSRASIAGKKVEKIMKCRGGSGFQAFCITLDICKAPVLTKQVAFGISLSKESMVSRVNSYR